MVDQKLIDFTLAYHAAIEGELDRRGRTRFPYHGESTGVVAIFKGKDGYVTFYLPKPENIDIARGLYPFDYAGESLNRICQSLSVHRLQVASPALHVPAYHPFDAIADEPPIPEIDWPWIHDEVRSLATSGQLDFLPGTTITPIISIEDGLRKEVVPARVKIWSPTFQLPNGAIQRLFLWTHADFWWFCDQLPLDVAHAQTAACNDVLALEAVFASLAECTAAGTILRVPYPATVAEKNTTDNAATILDAYCTELAALLNNGDTDEETIHQWLHQDCHHIFLDPHVKRMWSKLPFGAMKSDFVVLRSDDTYRLIEIEDARTRIFQKASSEPTARFNHACQQVRDWRRYVKDNVQTVRHELGLQGIYDPRGMVILGRSADIDTDAARTRWMDMKNTWDLDLYTYDELCDNVRSLAQALRTTMIKRA